MKGKIDVCNQKECSFLHIATRYHEASFIKCWVFIRRYIFLICFVKCSDVMRMNVYCVPYTRIRRFLIFYQLYCTQIFTAGNAYICLYLCAVYLYRVSRKIIKSIVFLNTALIYHVRLYCLNIRLQKAWCFVLCDKSRTCDCTVVDINIIDSPRALSTLPGRCAADGRLCNATDSTEKRACIGGWRVSRTDKNGSTDFVIVDVISTCSVNVGGIRPQSVVGVTSQQEPREISRCNGPS